MINELKVSKKYCHGGACSTKMPIFVTVNKGEVTGSGHFGLYGHEFVDD